MQPNTPEKPAVVNSPPLETVVKDSEALEAKNKIVRSSRSNSMLNSVSKVAAFVAGPLFAAGLLQAFTAAFANPAGFMAGIAAVTAAPVTMGILAVGAAFVGLAVATDYMASRKWQGNNFDNLEANAQSTARNLVKEMEAHKLCITNQPEHEGNQRADGKQWTQALAEQQSAQFMR